MIADLGGILGFILEVATSTSKAALVFIVYQVTKEEQQSF
jgi:hypothetical protein